MRIVRQAFTQFHNALQKWPLRTQMVTGGTLTFLGDVIAQQGIEKRTLDEHDWVRSARMGFFAIVVWTWVGYKWYDYTTVVFLGQLKTSLTYHS